MNDILPPEVSKWQFVEEKARSVLESFFLPRAAHADS
jgi:histidyl-tRNA synthetase